MTTNKKKKESWTFLQAGDSHIGTPRSYRFRPAIHQRWSAIKLQMAEIGPELLIHGGDLTRDGETHEYEYQLARDDLDTLPFPTFVIPGNMDVGKKHITLNGVKPKERGWVWNDVDLNMTKRRLDLFSSYFGSIHWSFLYRNVRFTGFFAAVAGSNFPHEERMWWMLERLPSLPVAKYHVAMMHHWPFMEHLDEPSWDITNPKQYDDWYFTIDMPHRKRLWNLLQAANVDILFCNHVHTGRSVQVVDGIRIYRTAASGNTAQLADRWSEAETRFGFQRCDVTEYGIEVTFIPGADQCDEFDSYGPWGHPPIEERDYSGAREKPSLVPDKRDLS